MTHETEMSRIQLMSSAELAPELGVSIRTLERWRMDGDFGPPFVRLGRLIFYRVSDVNAWIDEHSVSTAELIARHLREGTNT